MLPQYIAVVSLTESVASSDVMTVAGALQKQVTRDLAPIWGVTGTVSAFASRFEIPTDYWPIFVVDDVPEGAGYHRGADDGKPYAVVEAGPTWSLTASHECLEMMTDPFGDRLVAGQSILDPGERVEYLVEICDPCDNEAYAYSVNGVLVSDFCTPRYFDPVPSPSTRYSYNGSITAPRQLLERGYISWRNPETRGWHRASLHDGAIRTEAFGELFSRDGPLRAQIDARTPEVRRLSKLNPNSRRLRGFTKKKTLLRKSMRAQADVWGRELSRITGDAKFSEE